MRLELTRKTDLALRALRVLVDSDELHKGVDLAGVLGTTSAFLSQVVAPLSRAGWVRSVPGPRGGYEATQAAAGVSVLQLIEAVEGPVETGRCVLRPQPCPAELPCALHDAWLPAREALVDRLAATPVLSAVRSGGGG
jgi:Rrf2 family iron-sulfur cluster assembly transcriptional regulator